MDKIATLLIIAVFLFYAAVAAVFIFAWARRWIWPFLKERLPHGQSLGHQSHVRSTDREHSPF